MDSLRAVINDYDEKEPWVYGTLLASPDDLKLFYADKHDTT